MKYRNIKTVVDGIEFDSKKEAKRYLELKLLEKSGEINGLLYQVSFELAPSVKYSGAKRATPALRYVADFVYQKNGKTVVEDAKGMRTQAYKIKRHLMLALLGKEVKEV